MGIPVPFRSMSQKHTKNWSGQCVAEIVKDVGFEILLAHKR